MTESPRLVSPLGAAIELGKQPVKREINFNSSEPLMRGLKSLPDILHPLYLAADFEIKPQVELDDISDITLNWYWQHVETNDYADLPPYYAMRFIPSLSTSQSKTRVAEVINDMEVKKRFPKSVSYRFDTLPNVKHKPYPEFIRELTKLEDFYNPEGIWISTAENTQLLFTRTRKGFSIKVERGLGELSEDKKTALNGWLAELVKI